jgi:hypothetical protein
MSPKSTGTESLFRNIKQITTDAGLRIQTKMNILDFASKWIDSSCEAVDKMSNADLLRCNYAPGNYPPKDE